MGAQTSWAKGANADGSVVVGYVSNFDGNNHAFRWTVRDKIQDLGTLGGSTSSASGISANGNVVVGMAFNEKAEKHAFIWKKISILWQKILPLALLVWLQQPPELC